MRRKKKAQRPTMQQVLDRMDRLSAALEHLLKLADTAKPERPSYTTYTWTSMSSED